MQLSATYSTATLIRGVASLPIFPSINDHPASCLPSDLRKPLHVRFTNLEGLAEPGIDGGGLFREFLSQLLQIGFDPNRGFFKANHEGQLHPNPQVRLQLTTTALHGDFVTLSNHCDSNTMVTVVHTVLPIPRRYRRSTPHSGCLAWRSLYHTCSLKQQHPDWDTMQSHHILYFRGVNTLLTTRLVELLHPCFVIPCKPNLCAAQFSQHSQMPLTAKSVSW